MTATAGLQCGFGYPLGEVLIDLARFPFPIIRLDLQRCDQTTTTLLAQEVIDAGLQPLCIIRSAEQMTVLPTGSLMELGNEPDLEHEGWTPESYIAAAAECVAIALQLNLRLYLGAVSNLNPRGFNFLRKLPWSTYPPEICCSIHRYPNGSSPLKPHTGSTSREHEIATLRRIVGARPYACSEVGYYDQGGHWNERDVARHMQWERNFFSEHGFEICSAYQLNDGPADGEYDFKNHYGFRRLDGEWKPVAYAFTAKEQ